MALLSFLATAAAAHVAPNIMMKTVKSTHMGHKMLTGSFSAGLDMGRKGMKLQNNVRSFLEYGIGPESTVEYHLGRKLGENIKHLNPDEQNAYLRQFRRGILDQVDNLTREQRADLHKTPLLNTLYMYANKDGENMVKKGLMKFAVPEEGKMTVKNHAINAGVLGAAALGTHGHAILQPVISATRKFVSESALGKQFMKNGLQNGIDGKVPSKWAQFAWDMAVSPAALDPMRIGQTIGKHVPHASTIMKSNDPYQSVEKVFNEMTGIHVNLKWERGKHDAK